MGLAVSSKVLAVPTVRSAVHLTLSASLFRLQVPFPLRVQHEASGETSGLFFGKAIDLAGLYIEIVMLTAIFSLAQSGDMGNKKLSAIPPREPSCSS